MLYILVRHELVLEANDGAVEVFKVVGFQVIVSVFLTVLHKELEGKLDLRLRELASSQARFAELVKVFEDHFTH